MTKLTKLRLYSASFPVAGILLGLFGGSFIFFHLWRSEGDLVENFVVPLSVGLTITYLTLSLGLNIGLAKQRRAKRNNSIKF